MFKNQKGLGLLATILVVVIIVVAIAVGYYFYQQKSVEQPAGEATMEGEDVTEGSYTDVSASEAKELIDTNPDLIVIDVSPDYDNGHLPGAVNYYLGDGSLDAAIPTLDKDATYLVYCHIFSASSSGAQKLVDAGFENVYRLEGEYDAWVDAGYEIEK